MTPEEILHSTSPKVAKLIEQILQIEREYQHYQNLEANRHLETEICNRIVKAIDEEVMQDET